MGLFDMLFGNKKRGDTQAVDVDNIKEEIRNDLSLEIAKENDLLRGELSLEIGKIHDNIAINNDDITKLDEKIEKINRNMDELMKKFSDLSVLGRVAIDNRERLDKYKNKMATKDELEALRREILNLNPMVKAIDDIPVKTIAEPRKPLSHILEELPKSRRVLVDILMHAENPISYRQIANTMGLTYNTIKVYVRDVREAGFPIEEYMAQNKKLLNIPNSVKAALLYSQ